MKDEYDFSTAMRGRFSRGDAPVVPPVHLDPEVLVSLSELAAARGISLNALVNMLLKERLKRRQ